MRCAAVACVIALLLPGVPPTGGRVDDPDPLPLAFLGGGNEPASWTAPAVVAEAYYNALRGDEYVALANTAAAPLDLSGWTLTDLEGVLAFPTGALLPAGGRIAVAQNASMYYEDTLRPADFRYGGGNATPMLSTGTFQLNNAGDEVLLRDASGRTMDVFAYDGSTYAGEGWTGPPASGVGQGNVAQRAFDGSWRDTNTSADWDLVRVWSLGQSEFGSASYSFTGRVRAFATPDAQVDPLLDLVQNATSTIDLSLYTFTNSALLGPLATAIGNGVRVRILLEGAPVGGIDRDEWSLLQALAPSAQLHFLVDNTTLDIQERYRYGHAKYAILDGRIVAMSTENWGASAFPTWAASGSRGWVVVVDHAPLAAYFAAVFEGDFDLARRDVFDFAEMAANPVTPTRDVPIARSPVFPPGAFDGAFRVIPVLAPDTALAPETILAVLQNATESIHVEMFYAYTAWGPYPNAYLEALFAAARRGVSVRLLLDASAYNIEGDDPIDNDNTVLFMSGVAAAEDLDLEAKLIDLDLHELSRMHTKGFVVDRRWTLVSSINWNRNSPTANREAGLLIENDALAGYFDRVFAWDWKDDFTPPRADAGPDRAIPAGDTVTWNGLGSSDDGGIVNWSWDLDGDGADDAWGPEVSRAYRAPGTVIVRLRVSDLGNNTAEDTATLTVVAPPAGVVPNGLGIAALFIAAVGILIVVLLIRKRSRQRLSKPP